MSESQVLSHEFQKVVEQLPVVVFEYTLYPSGHRGFTYVSPKCAELLGLDSGVFLGDQPSIENHIHPDDLQGFHLSIEQSISAVSDWLWRGRCQGRNGCLWIEAKGSPVRADDGRVVYHGIFSDITETRRMADQNQANETRYRNLIEQLPLGIVVHSGGFIRFANSYAAKALGATDLKELNGREVAQFVHPEFKVVAAERTEIILKGHSVPVMETKFVRLDGREIIVESSGHPYVFDGSPAVQVIFADITDRKMIETGFRKTETLFFELFQNTPLALVLLNERGEVVKLNRGFENLFGYTYRDLVGKTLTQAIVPSELEKEGNEINNLIAENKVVRVETVRRRQNGQQVSVIIYGVPVILQNEKIGIFGMYVDITERQKVEEELKVRNAELDNFVYKVSHDLRAPLSSVLGLAHLAAMPGNRDDLSEYVRLMGEKALQLDHFISDVLSHSKNLKMDVSIDQVDLTGIIERTFDDLNYLAGKDELTRVVSVTGSDFYSDQWRIGEIFRNLVSNAIKYRKIHSDECKIRVEVCVTNIQCEIEVEDNGIGIEETLVPRIFEMFFRASDRSDGSGLGLYIVKNAVDRLGGTVEVSSKVGQGSLFRVVLPNLISK